MPRTSARCAAVEATVDLGDLKPEDVRCSCSHGPVGQGDEIVDPALVPMTLVVVVDGSEARYRGAARVRASPAATASPSASCPPTPTSPTPSSWAASPGPKPAGFLAERRLRDSHAPENQRRSSAAGERGLAGAVLEEDFTPTCVSSVRKTSTKSSCSSSRPSASARSRPPSIARLASACAASAPLASSAASSSARSCRASGGDDLVGQPDPQRLLGLDLAAGEDHVLGPRRPDQPGEALRATAARDDAEQDLGLAEPRLLRRDAEVAGERQLAAAAERVARRPRR